MSDNEDEKFWFDTVKDVVKIPQSDEVHITKKNKPIKIRQEQTVPLTIYKHELKLGTSSDIDRQTMKKFKREEFGVEGILDLHGFTEERAYPAVYNFITSS